MVEKDAGWGDSSRIKTIDTIETIRIRPGMYVGGTEPPRQHHLAYLILDNVLENCRAGRGDTVMVTCRGSRVVISDNGPAFAERLLDERTPTEALDKMLSELVAGDRGVVPKEQVRDGLPIVRALSASFVVMVRYNGEMFHREFEKGKPVSDWETRSEAAITPYNFCVSFSADPTIFSDTSMSRGMLRERLQQMAATCTGLKAYLANEDEGVEEISMPGGMRDLLAAKHEDQHYVWEPREPMHIVVRSEDLEFDLAAQWAPPERESKIYSWANSIRTTSGTHVLGLREALREVGLDDLSYEAALSVFIPEPRYSRPTKSHLANPEIRGLVRDHAIIALRSRLSDAEFAVRLDEWRAGKD